MAKHIKALVTGGAGFIGSHLCEELLRRSFSVVAIDDFSTGCRENISGALRDKNFKFYKNSILNGALIRKLIRECDIVYHLAAAVGVKYILEHPIGSMLTNIEGTQVILQSADKYRKKVIITSTSEVYGKHACSPFSEEDDRILGSTSISRWSYSDAKAVDEFLALAYAKERKLPVVIVRLFNTAGPRQVGRYGMVLPRFIEEALAGKPITVYGDGLQIRSFAHVKDVVRPIIGLSLKKEAQGQIFNIGNDQPITIKELALRVKERAHSKSKIKYISFKDAFKNKSRDFEEIECRIPDIGRLKKILHFKPRYDIDTIIEDSINHFIGRKRNK